MIKQHQNSKLRKEERAPPPLLLFSSRNSALLIEMIPYRYDKKSRIREKVSNEDIDAEFLFA